MKERIWGSYDTSDWPNTATAKALMPELIEVQRQLRETVTPEIWEWIEQYRTLLNRRHTAEREQTFAAGFQSAMTMLACPAADKQEVCGDGKS